MVPQSSAKMIISVTAATMHTVDSDLTSAKALSRPSRLAQAMTWADFILAREAMFKVVMFRRTLPSPMMEKSLETDIGLN